MPPLEYFAPADPQRGRVRLLTGWSILLLLGWLPYVCGIVNASTLAIAYSPEVIRAHTGGAIIFMAAGIVISAVSLGGFLHARHATGAIAAGSVLLLQATMLVCLGALR